jgi:hypothetical protein
VRLRADFPLIQAQPLPREAYAEHTLNSTSIGLNMAAMSDEDWGAYQETIVTPSQDPNREFGAYTVAARKRRRAVCPFSKMNAVK